MSGEENLIDMITEYCDMRHSNRDIYSLGTAISTVSTIAGSAVHTDDTCPLQTSSITYIILLGESNSAKSTVISFTETLLKEIGYTNVISNDITPEEFIPYLREHKHVLMRVGEFSSLLSSYKTKQYMSGLREKLIVIYDGAPLVQSRTSRGNVTIKDYAVCIESDTQPDVLRVSVSIDDIASGMIPRFIWFPLITKAIQEPPRILSQEGKILKNRILRSMTILYQYSKGRKIYYVFTQDQVDRIYRFVVSNTSENAIFDPIYARVVQIVYKLSMLRQYASSDFIESIDQMRESKNSVESYTDSLDSSEEIHNPYNVCEKELHIDVLDEYVQWALDFAERYVKEWLPFVFNALTFNDADKIRAIVKHYSNDLDHRWMPQSVLLRRAQLISRDPATIEKIVKFAIKLGYIKEKRFNAGISYRYVPDDELNKSTEQLHKEIREIEDEQARRDALTQTDLNDYDKNEDEE